MRCLCSNKTNLASMCVVLLLLIFFAQNNCWKIILLRRGTKISSWTTLAWKWNKKTKHVQQHAFTSPLKYSHRGRWVICTVATIFLPSSLFCNGVIQEPNELSYIWQNQPGRRMMLYGTLKRYNKYVELPLFSNTLLHNRVHILDK